MMILIYLTNLIILLYSAILHEIAHGFVAEKLGDPTARIMGRLTLNPKPHIDPMMSIALPLILILSGSPIIFGAAKPVPVDPFNLKEGRKDLALVSLAGPLTNILLAVIASLCVKAFAYFGIGGILPIIFSMIADINLLLAIFNLIPIPPLDGSKIFALLLPEREANTYMSLSSIGFFILIFLLMFPIAGFSLQDLIYNLLSFAKTLLGV